MSETIKFSVVIPSYNRAHCILDAIESVLKQNYSNYEVIVVDDGSTDDTREKIKNIEHEKTIFFKELEHNRGPNIARNIGSEMANGDWLVFLDSDDKLTNNALWDIKESIDNSNCDLLFVPAVSIDGQNRSSYNDHSGYITYKEVFRRKLKNGIEIKGDHLPCVKRKVFLSVKFYENIIGGEGLTWKRIAKNNVFYTSSKSSLIVNSRGDDRLSELNNKNLNRILKIKIFDLQENFKDYIRLAPMSLISNIGKVVYYFVIINFNNVRNFWFNSNS